MGEKDISEKILLDYNDVFADILNVFVFNGKQVVKPEDLENMTVHAQYKAEDGKLHEEERDIAKYWKSENVKISIFGIENQMKVDMDMPFRIIGYDGAAYRAQLLNGGKSVVPVVTFVLYFGTDKRWNQSCSLKSLLEIPEGLEGFVSDYTINVFEIAWLSDEQLNLFKSDFGIVANFFVQKRKNKDYVPDDKRVIKHVDEVLKLLSVITGDKGYEKVLYLQDNTEKRKVKHMCEVVDRLYKMGEQKERLRLVRVKLEKGKSVEAIADSLEVSVEEVNGLIELLEKE